MALNVDLHRVLREVRRRSPFTDDGLVVDPSLRPADLRRLSEEIKAVIDGRGGSASSRRRARTIGLAYETLDQQGRRRFFELLADAHGHDDAEVDRAMARVFDAGDPAARRRAEGDLRQALQPGHGILLRRLAGQDGGLPFLVDLRGHLLDVVRPLGTPERTSSPPRPLDADDPTESGVDAGEVALSDRGPVDEPDASAVDPTPGGDDRAPLGLGLRDLDRELRRILVDWFDVGLLRLDRLTWDTPAAFLEKLIAYEAVHAIESWDDLKARLSQGRRCYAFVHPAMPDDPLIFVEVALTKGLPAELGPVLDRLDDDGDASPGAGAEAQADTATFYSISNCHRGLAGVSLGDLLIKSVVEELAAELPNLKTFATLSPVPGLRGWLAGQGLEPEDPTERRDELLHLAARYLTATNPEGRALDPVAHFHYANGAGLERINWMANPRPAGIERGFGLMVNYRYDLRTIERNHDRYAEGRGVTASDDVRRLAERPPDPPSAP
jgi:malonyl-CoA decarboxylase